MKDNKLIGNTPMIKINYEYNGKKNYIYTKLEYYNMTGSIKDRVAHYIITKAKERGELKDGMPIIEATSGNTGIALAALGKSLGHPVHIFMPDWVSKERIELIKSYGASVYMFSRDDGGFIRSIDEAKKFTTKTNGFLANQFANYDNYLAHYETTGEEIIRQLTEEAGGFVSGVGTGGTLMGVGDKLKERFKDLIVAAIEPDKMPLLSGGTIIGNHKIEGIGDDFIPELIDKNKIDEVLLVNDDDAINMARKISNELGIGVGISSGANFLGSVLLSDKINKKVVTVFADDNKKYLSTDLSKPHNPNETYISNKITLLGIEEI